jgi:hypothetical protein
MLIKLDDQQLGWMAADRARVLASGGCDPLAVGEAAWNLAVLARKAGWHEQASSIALSAAASPLLAGTGARQLTSQAGDVGGKRALRTWNRGAKAPDDGKPDEISKPSSTGLTSRRHHRE